MGTKRHSGPQPISLLRQRLVLQDRYPAASAIPAKGRLIWRGELTPTEYSDSYEVVIDHDLTSQPLVYVARPRLQVVEGKQLPHVFPMNTLCLHTLDRARIASSPLADTLVPWTVEWLFFYEVWLATGGRWLGEGIHLPGRAKQPDAALRRSRKTKDARMARLASALCIAYGSEAIDLDELLYNARL